SRGQVGGEGHYGIALIGAAQVENCNRSATCCDMFTGGTDAGCFGGSYACSGVVGTQEVPIIKDPSTYAPPRSATLGGSVVAPYADLFDWGLKAKHACGPALRLTASHPRQAGAAWYMRDQPVGEGFTTTFTFRLSNPSQRCQVMDGTYTKCRSRGADGLAFVIQNEGLESLGEGGSGLGYSGIGNALAIEFDTFYNPELLDPYENHVSVNTRGWRERIESNTTYSLSYSSRIPDLTDGVHTVKLVYTPTFDPSVLTTGRFSPSGYVGDFLQNKNFPVGGMGDWGSGIGLLHVYVDDMKLPVLSTPLNLEATLELNHGRAWVGFTAATGDETWQVHDILHWEYTSTREVTY
ncbi:unnamed protein product, partial [Chrysoparadoxa australica]